MKISYNWLKSYISIDLPVEEVAAILTETGLEVESVEKKEAVQGGLAGVVVAEVLTCEKHPDADKLKVTTVTIGDEPLQVVCGAPNVAAGQKVLLATVGSTIYPEPDQPLKLKVSKIRGVESHGMLCAEDELGLGHSHEGILVLDSQFEVGTPAATVFDLEDDHILEIGLTPNRADAMGHIGVARDLRAYLQFRDKKNTSINWPSIESFHVQSTDSPVEIEVLDHVKCPKYYGVTISNIEVKPSPAWLQKRLRSVGLSPINNVVDVTNFVMRELGTPLHAFDLKAIGNRVVVRCANDGEMITTLDGAERKLNTEDLVICNQNEPMCIAGVFGGEHSGISDSTTSMFLESAYFQPVSIRKTSKLHGLSTDASFRFERGVDPALTEYALKRAALLIQEVAGGQISMSPFRVDDGSIALFNRVEFATERFRSIAGVNCTDEEIIEILGLLDIQVVSNSHGQLSLEVPAYRVDVTREIDVIEEVLRIYSFNNVPFPDKWNMSGISFPKPNPEKIQSTAIEFLVGKGFVEMMNNSLVSSSHASLQEAKQTKEEHQVKLLNPLSLELDAMRQTLIYGALDVIAYNQNRQQANLKLLEFGKVYHKFESGYAENKRLILALTGKQDSDHWNGTNQPTSFYQLKGILVALLHRLGLSNLSQERAIDNELFADGTDWYILKKRVASIGWVTDDVLKKCGVKQAVFIADIDWDLLLDAMSMVKIQYKEVPKTFAVRRDFSMLLKKEIRFSEIEHLARAIDKKILKEVGLFDVYEGKNLPEGQKSYAVSFHFQDDQQTLRDEQVDGLMQRIRERLEAELGAQIRE